MRTFACDRCDHALFFESDTCVNCQRRLGFAVDVMALITLDLASGVEGHAQALYSSAMPDLGGRRFRRCKNDVEFSGCNWLVDERSPSPYCLSCRLNDVVPNLDDSNHSASWRTLERWKRRLVYSLLALGLPVESRAERPETGLTFRLLAGTPEAPVTTGHADGVITIDLAEARSSFREEMKEKLGERYRTVLGHFRHEVGHYYWDRIVQADPNRLSRFRAAFGDERADYQQALERHYATEPKPDWQSSHVSAYATMHPWEDWAETWAHYLHAVDTLETARSYGLVVSEPGPGPNAATHGARQLEFSRFAQLFGAWGALSLALNGLNRSMGLADAYPFAPSDVVRGKLELVHEFIREAAVGQRWLV